MVLLTDFVVVKRGGDLKHVLGRGVEVVFLVDVTYQIVYLTLSENCHHHSESEKN